MNDAKKLLHPILIRCLARDTEVPPPSPDSHVEIQATDLELGGQPPETWGFKESAELLVPYMLDLPARTKGALTELAIDVSATVFSDEPSCVWEMELQLRDKVVDTRQYHNFTQCHQFIVPTSLLFEDVNTIKLSARAISGPRLAPRFSVRVFYLQQDRLLDAIEQSSVWVFSTARSGSSWLSQDILCHGDDARSMDEPGIGRLFAPVDWVAERFYDLAHKDAYSQAGLDYETGAKKRADAGFIPPFERSFMFGGQENSIWSAQNRRMYLDLIRTTMFQHVLHEWGVLDYQSIVFKMPNDSHAADVIMEALPKAFMILLMRDGRDVMKSRFSPFASPDLATTTDPALRLHAIAFYAHWWNFQVDIMQAAFDAHAPERRLLLSYEELRVAPTVQLRVMFDMIGIKISDAALDELVNHTRLENIPASQKGPDKPRQTGEIGKYAKLFSGAEIALMEAIMGRNLRRFGYIVGDGAGYRAGLDRSAPFEFPLGDDGFGSGWYRLERAARGPFRWTGPEQVATIDLLLPKYGCQFVFRYRRPFSLIRESLAVTVNGQPLAVTVTEIDEQTRDASFTIPAELVPESDAATQIAIDVGEGVRPSDRGEADERMLGIVVSRIVITPIPGIAPPGTVSPPAQAEPAAPTPAPEPRPVEVPIIGDGEPLGAVEGLFVDGWVGPSLRLTIQPHRPVRRVTVHGWFHEETPEGELSLRIGDQTVMRAMAPGMFTLSVHLPADTMAAIALEMDATHWVMTGGPDGRNLVFMLQRIMLE